MNRALILDRDGVINKEIGYLHTIDDFEFVDGVFETCASFQNAGYRIVVVTNQAGIGRGYYSEEQYQQLTDWMISQFAINGIVIDSVFHCPHHPTHGVGVYKRECNCRKPAAGMLHQAQKALDLELEKSIMVGDKASDMMAAKAAGVGTLVLVRSGNAIEDTDIALADMVLESIAELQPGMRKTRIKV